MAVRTRCQGKGLFSDSLDVAIWILVGSFGECARNVTVEGEPCEELQICVGQGTTSIDFIEEQLFDPKFLVAKPTGSAAIGGLESGDCKAVAGGIAETSERSVRFGGYSGDYDVNVDCPFTDEPLALVTRDDDPVWSDFVFWVVSGLMYAEEANVTNVTWREMPQVNVFGPMYINMLRHAVQAVGSYGEVFERNSNGGVPRRGKNLLNQPPFGPQLFPLPFESMVQTRRSRCA